MFRNTGSYGPNDAPGNMSASLNMTVPDHNIPHNLSNYNKIQQPLPQPSVHNYPYNQFHMGQQVNPFQSYHNSTGFHANYFSESQPNAWQNGMIPPQISAHNDINTNIAHYNASFNKRTECTINTNPTTEIETYPQSIVFNVPQVPTKAFQKHGSNNNDSFLYNNEDKHDNEQKIKEISTKSDHNKPLMDDSKRRSLENTVKLIENILIHSSSKAQSTSSSTDKDKYRSEGRSETLESTDKSSNNADEEMLSDCDDVKLDSDNDIEGRVSDYDSDEHNSDDNESEKQSDEDYDPEEDIDDESDKIKKIDIDNSDTDESVQEDKPKKITNQNENTQSEVVTKVEIKVEASSWADLDCFNPFCKDGNGNTREDVTGLIVDGENCITMAEEALKTGTSEDFNFECHHCSLVFKGPKRFLIHNKWHLFGLTNDKRMEEAKAKELKRKSQIEARVMERMKAKEVTDLNTTETVYPCKDCDKVFSVRNSLKNHRHRFHPSNRLHQCKVCQISVPGFGALRAHLATHAADVLNGFQCPECPKRYKYAHSLAKHRDTHLEKTHQCPECPKLFGSPALLKMHMKVHERAQRGATYRCSFCAKSFFESYNLQVHERIHRNERPFKCEICGTAFMTNSSLRRHLKVSHNDSKPFECSICHRCFMQESIRDRHQQRVHASPEDFKFLCPGCTRRFLNRRELQKHITKEHPKLKRRKKTSEMDDDFDSE